MLGTQFLTHTYLPQWVAPGALFEWKYIMSCPVWEFSVIFGHVAPLLYNDSIALLFPVVFLCQYCHATPGWLDECFSQCSHCIEVQADCMRTYKQDLLLTSCTQISYRLHLSCRSNGRSSDYIHLQGVVVMGARQILTHTFLVEMNDSWGCLFFIFFIHFAW